MQQVGTEGAQWHDNAQARRRGMPPALDGDTAPGIAQVSLATLIQRAAIETQHFQKGQPSDTRYAYEIFRLALVERHEQAWEFVYTTYTPFVLCWIQRSNAYDCCGETAEFLANIAFTRFWQAISPANFAQFPALPSLLSYLRCCADCVVIDHARAQRRTALLPQRMAAGRHNAETLLEDEIVRQLRGRELWHCIAKQVRNETEWIILYNSFVGGMKPAEIYRCYPQFFQSVTSVYALKRSLLDRLGRNEQVRHMLE